MAIWTWLFPALSLLLLGALSFTGVGSVLAVVCCVALIGSVIAAVHHAEVVAHRVGEPFGTLVLALAVCAIETALIVSMMLAGGAEMAALPRDTLYAAVMIIANGVVGVCILIGGLHHREQSFRVEGASAGLAALLVLSMLVLVLPVFTSGEISGTYSRAQLIFVAVAALLLWGIFVFIQTVRHRDYFIPSHDASNPEVHAPPPSVAHAWTSFGLLIASLVAVVGLAKKLSPFIEMGVEAFNAPEEVVGIVIAALVLMPETWAAARAAQADRLQTSMNLAIGSAIASIGLTVPLVVVVAIAMDLPLILGLDPKGIVMLTVTFLLGAITLATGRTHFMHGAVHLVMFAAYLFLAFSP